MSKIFEEDSWTEYGLGVQSQFRDLVQKWFNDQAAAGCSIRELSHACVDAVQELEVLAVLDKRKNMRR